MKASILFYFLTSSNLNVPKMVKSCPPCAPRRLCLVSLLSPVVPACFWLVVVSYLSSGGRVRPRCILFFYFFCRSIRLPKQRDGVPPTPASASSTAQNLRTLVGEQRRNYLRKLCPAHGEGGGASRWRVGRRPLMLVVVCVLCVFCGSCFTHFVE